MSSTPAIALACEGEKPCRREGPGAETLFIVITGGPGAGKTAVLESLKKILCHQVVVVPEAASIVFKGGFWRFESVSSQKATQRAIYYIQHELENIVRGERRWQIALCDRGTLDGLAYWVGEEKEFFASFNTTKEKQFAKYHAVIHLRTPSLELGYNHQNPFRVESVIDAAKIDERLQDIWRNHERHFVIDVTQDFVAKITHVADTIQTFLPECCRPCA